MSGILDQTHAATLAAQDGVYTHNSMGGPSQAQMTQSFPRGGLGAESSRDELMKQKMEFMQQNAAG